MQIYFSIIVKFIWKQIWITHYIALYYSNAHNNNIIITAVAKINSDCWISYIEFISCQRSCTSPVEVQRLQGCLDHHRVAILPLLGWFQDLLLCSEHWTESPFNCRVLLVNEGRGKRRGFFWWATCSSSTSSIFSWSISFAFTRVLLGNNRVLWWSWRWHRQSLCASVTGCHM